MIEASHNLRLKKDVMEVLLENFKVIWENVEILLKIERTEETQEEDLHEKNNILQLQIHPFEIFQLVEKRKGN